MIVVQAKFQGPSNKGEISPHVLIHFHEEADTVIPLHVIDTLRSGLAIKNADVHCDIIILLMDLLAKQ